MFIIPKIPVGKIVKVSSAFLTKHAPDILTGCAVAGTVSTAILAGRAVLKAERYINSVCDEHASEDTRKAIRRQTYKYYAPAVATGLATVGCIVGANAINHKKIAGLVAACTVAETALQENKDKIEELFGDKNLKLIEESKAIDKGLNAIHNSEEVVETGHGNALFVEGYLTGTKFRADINWVKKCVNDYNEIVNHDTYADFNEYLERHGIHTVKAGANLGYNVHVNGLMRIELFPEIDLETGETYTVIMQQNEPVANFMTIY